MGFTVVGLLPKSSHENRFILVICDYATRYPEAVPMRHIDAASVAEEFVEAVFEGWCAKGDINRTRYLTLLPSYLLNYTRCYMYS